MSEKQICMLISMAVYMVVVLIIGIICAKRNKTADDFYLGGRKLNPLVAAMSAEASDMSSWLLMGLPGLAFLSGVADAGWTAIGLAVGTYLNWLIVAKRLRRYTVVARNSITLPDFFSNRFHDKHKILMSVSALMILIFFVPYTASGFAACGKLFSSLFQLDYFWAMLLSAVVIVAYTTIGGFLAASTTDLMQGIVMSIALVIVLVFGISTAGGVGAVMENAQNMPGFLSMFDVHVPATGGSEPYGFLKIVSMMAWGLGYFGMPHVLLRFMAIRSEHQLKTSRRIASVWVVISLFVSVMIGVIGAKAIPELLDRSSLVGAGADTLAAATSQSETIFIKIADTLANSGILPALLAGVILAGILAATMSTADSQLLAASSSVAQNFFKGLICKNAKEKTTMWVARGTVIVIAIIAVMIASDPNSSVFEIVSFAWAGFGATFGPLVLFSLFWKRTTLQGALAGMVSGGVMIFLWKFLIKPLGGVWGIYELLPAFIVASILILVVSLLTKAPSQEIVDEFELAADKTRAVE
ncbi:MAG: sodium/proline symporter PutP [Clostridiales bacterium]|nr:sodium/proline symporter PutP [Clostridiales bacterium]